METLLGDIKRAITRKFYEQLFKLLADRSDGTLIKALKLLEKTSPNEFNKKEARKFRWLIETGHPFRDWFRKVTSTLNANVTKKFVNNVLLSSWFLKREDIREDFKEKYGFFPPTLLVIDVTMRCNLNCDGCWAGSYKGTVPDMSIEELRRVITEARDKMGVHYFVIAGGEPFIRKDLLDLYAEFSDCQFHIYTNGTLIDEKTATRLQELGNCMLMISIEGTEETTDKRRNSGTYTKIFRAMSLLKEKGIVFGFSVTATRHNHLEISGEEFVKKMSDAGCLYGWYFQYVPIGRNPDTDLMVTAEQRDEMRHRVYDMRNKYPLLMADFWNDGPETNGCMAGGKLYAHVTCNGDVEPCVFCHFAVDNIKNKSLTEALCSPFFKDIREGIPYDGNHLRACMLIDRPEVFRKHYEKHKPKPTHPGSETFVTTLAPELDKRAAAVKRIYDPAWEKGDWMRLWIDPPADYV
jgi:MoaA/NifB/PqqE/SkfB family radical SAM enzyme